MTSFGDVQYPQNPFLDAASNINYDDISQSRGGNYYRHPTIPVHEDPYTSSGSSGYGDTAPSGYGPQHYPAHMHTGPSSSGYGAPVQHAPHPTQSTTFAGLKKGGNSAMSALALLSFFFFVNLLQTCLKEHMTTMNPTVMVMTNGVIRNRNNKVAEMNSRESTSTSPESISSNERVVIKPDLITTLTTNAPPPPPTIAATLTSVQHNKPAQENIQISNNNDAANLYPNPPNYDQPNFSTYDNNYQYPNRTTYRQSDRYHPQPPPQHYNDRYSHSHSHPHQNQDQYYHEETYSWPHRQHSHYDPSYWDRYDSRHFPNHDFYDDTPYLRIY